MFKALNKSSSKGVAQISQEHLSSYLIICLTHDLWWKIVCCIPDITIILLFKFTVAMFKQDLNIYYAAVVNEFKTTSSYVLLDGYGGDSA